MNGQYRELIRQKIVDALEAPIPPFTRRDVRLPDVPGKAVAVIGMRRTGKTTFLWQVLADRLREGTGREGLLYVGFEDKRLAGLTAADLHLVVEKYYRLYPEWRDGVQRAVFFLDEIQVVPGREAFARRLLDTERIELFLAGSSARLLSREVATSMRGRAMEALVHPLAFVNTCAIWTATHSSRQRDFPRRRAPRLRERCARISRRADSRNHLARPPAIGLLSCAAMSIPRCSAM